jgi:hypothetical protein
MAKIKIQKRGGYGVDYKIPRPGNIEGEIWWSPPWDGLNGEGSHGGFNSYVVCECEPPRHPEDRSKWKIGGKWVCLYSINGIGEIRWRVESYDIESAERHEEAGTYRPCDHEGYEAAKWFGLEPK